MRQVTWARPEYRQYVDAWVRADDFNAGELAVKDKGEMYLPRTNPLDNSQAAQRRYESYLKRATFFPVVSRTLRGMVGTAFRKDPQIELPTGLQYAIDDIDGCGVSIYQQSQRALNEVLLKDRCFLLVDYPTVEGDVSRADMATIRATVTLYKAESVINWRMVNGKLSLVVIKEYAEVEDDLQVEIVERYRVLELVDGYYTVSIYDKAGELVVEPRQPQDASGKRFPEITGCFVGSTVNDAEIDSAPMNDIIGMNLAHYQIYADWRKVLFLAANPQPVTSGLTQEWRDYLEKSGTLIGSDANLLLPVDGDFKWAQINADQPLRVELTALQEQMVAVGAKLLEKGGANVTAKQVASEEAAEHSVLSLACSNVSDAYERCLEWMGMFMGATGKIEYRIATDYLQADIDPQMLQALVAAWQSGTIAKSDAREYLKRSGILDPARTDEDIDGESDANPPSVVLDG